MTDTIIKQFKIKGLFGLKDISISFKSNVLIVIGENGFGKTTILNALNYTLQREWKKLANILFEEISIKFRDQAFSFTRKAVIDYCDFLSRKKGDDDGMGVVDYVRGNVGEEVLNDLISFIANRQQKEFSTAVSKSPVLKGIPTSILYSELLSKYERDRAFGVFDSISDYVKSLNCTILYLPTFRRVEVELDNLKLQRRRPSYSRYEEDGNRDSDWSNAAIRFGMEDVQEVIKTITSTISQSFVTGYAEASGDMIRQLLREEGFQQHILTCDHRQMEIILARIGNNLSKEEKEHILSMFDSKSNELLNKQYLVYFLEQLLSVYKKQEKYDSAIKSFCDVCNKYLKDKQFFYDESNVALGIYRTIDGELQIDRDHEVELRYLSSGEKQIVSIFAHVYLNVDKRFLVLLDEPELSLSIFWQENLIPDLIASQKCDFIMAVTHSPFIFGDKLRKNTIGINEFLENKRNG